MISSDINKAKFFSNQYSSVFTRVQVITYNDNIYILHMYTDNITCNDNINLMINDKCIDNITLVMIT